MQAPHSRVGRVGNDAPSLSLCADSASGHSDRRPRLYGKWALGRISSNVSRSPSTTVATTSSAHDSVWAER